MDRCRRVDENVSDDAGLVVSILHQEFRVCTVIDAQVVPVGVDGCPESENHMTTDDHEWKTKKPNTHQ